VLGRGGTVGRQSSRMSTVVNNLRNSNSLP
jgi:hypothetical protein